MTTKTDNPASQQQPRTPDTHNYYAPVYHISLQGVAPHAINIGAPCSFVGPHGRPFFQHSDDEAFSTAFQRRDGAVYVGKDMIFGPPGGGQVIRKLQADGEVKLYICDKELRNLYDQILADLRHGGNRISTDAFLQSALVLHWIFLHCQPSLTQHLSKALTTARNELSTLLQAEMRSFAGKGEQWQSEEMQDGPDQMRRLFFGYALSYLQSRPVSVAVDNEGRIHPKGLVRNSTRHIIEVTNDGITFDFRASFHPNSVFTVLWKDFRPLPTFGIRFYPEDLIHFPRSNWFGVWVERMSAPEPGPAHYDDDSDSSSSFVGLVILNEQDGDDDDDDDDKADLMTLDASTPLPRTE